MGLLQRHPHNALHGGRQKVALHGGDAARRLRGEEVDAEDVRVGARAVERDLGPAAGGEALGFTLAFPGRGPQRRGCWVLGGEVKAER